MTYESLVEDYGFEHGEFMASCMRKVEDVIVDSGLLKKRVAPPEAVSRVTIFMWVCGGLQVRDNSGQRGYTRLIRRTVAKNRRDGAHQGLWSEREGH